MKTHKISVTVDTDSIRVEPETQVMTSADEVQWAGQNGRPFKIVFDTHTVFGQRELEHAIATSRQRPRVHGRFKYTVVSMENPGLQLDPIIIVEEPPTPPPHP